MSAVTRVAALMSFRPVIVALFLLVLTGCNRESYSRSNSGFSSTDKKLLYDFRSQAAPRTMPDATIERKVLLAVFPSYVSEYRECSPLKPQETVVKIRGAAQGSFTAAGLRQTAYLIDVAKCTRPPDIATHRLLVFTDGTFTANVEAPIGSAILGGYDLDGDGKQNLLLEQQTLLGPAAVVKNAWLVEFDKDKLETVEDFGQIYDGSACNSNAGERSMRASVVYYLPPPPGQKPRFTVELYRAPCPTQGQQPQWTRVNAK